MPLHPRNSTYTPTFKPCIQCGDPIGIQNKRDHCMACKRVVPKEGYRRPSERAAMAAKESRIKKQLEEMLK